MYEMTANLTEVLPGLAMLVLAGAGYRAGRLVFRPTRRTLRRSAWVGLVLLGVAAVTLTVQVVLTGMLWSYGWDFAANRVLVALPVAVLPMVGVAALSLPRLWRIARAALVEPDAVVEQQYRAAAADPWLVVPIQAAAIGAVLDFAVVFVSRPVPPYGLNMAVLWAIEIAAAAALWLRQSRRRVLLSAATRVLRAGGVLLVLIAIGAGVLVLGTATSRLPDVVPMGEHQHGGGTSVVELTGPRTGTPDARFTLTAQATRVRLTSGAEVDGLTYNGQAPGPELRVRQGDLVEVTLVNAMRAGGVTVHWHGLDVPNAEDGVAGVTQDAVPPGGRHVYRFRAEQVGTFWYHSHQDSAEAVARGLFGPLVVAPRTPAAAGSADLTVLAHTWRIGDALRPALGTNDTLERRAIRPGTPVRLRVVNTDNNTVDDTAPRTLSFQGTAFRVAAVDGTDLNEPGELRAARLPLAAGGRYDLTFTMPDGPVRLTDDGNPSGGLLLSPDGRGEPPAVPADAPLFDPARYGRPAPTPFNTNSRFDRDYKLIFDDGPGFYDGRFLAPPTINGKLFPDVPMLMVREGELVWTTFVNRSHNNHPMHLHGHHMLVLTRNGRPTSGSPWWTDTLDVRPGEIFEVAFRADNPGLWMDHCHNLDHAAQGMVMHLGYEGVTSPFAVGHATGNQPE